jgi:hypothetical protein
MGKMQQMNVFQQPVKRWTSIHTLEVRSILDGEKGLKKYLTGKNSSDSK